mgnify:CR=1 FL=1
MHEAPCSLYIIFDEDDNVFGFTDSILEAQDKTVWLMIKYDKNFYFEKYELVEE